MNYVVFLHVTCSASVAIIKNHRVVHKHRNEIGRFGTDIYHVYEYRGLFFMLSFCLPGGITCYGEFARLKKAKKVPLRKRVGNYYECDGADNKFRRVPVPVGYVKKQKMGKNWRMWVMWGWVGRFR